MPELTKVDVSCGFSGLMVVFAFLKLSMPDKPKKAPTQSDKIIAAKRIEAGNVKINPSFEIPHMISIEASMITGGGILFSR